MADVVLELDYSPYGLVVEWPYIYVVGTANGYGGVYTERVVKYRVYPNSIDVIDDATHLSQATVACYYGCSLGNLSINHLFCCGTQKVGSYYKAVVRKVNKSNLSDVAWSCLENGGGTVGNWMSAKEDSSGNVFTAGSEDQAYPGVGRGWVSRINAWGARTHIVANIYSTMCNILDFLNVGGTDYVDITGSYGGYRFIYRYRMSNLYQLLVGGVPTPFYRYGGYIPANYYVWYNGVLSSEGGIDYYYLPGWTGVDAYHPEQSLLKMDRSQWALEYPNANVWESLRDIKAGWISEYEGSCVIDGSYVYTLGLFYDASVNVPPITATFRKHSYSGVQQWAVNHTSINRVPFIASLGQYGDYIITGLYNADSGTPKGWLEFRNKSDGAVATYPISDVTFGPEMYEIMRLIKWFTGKLFRGCYLGWR